MPQAKARLPEVMVFAGPNGSGKSTITRMANTVGEYINADDIRRASLCTDLEAAERAESLREAMLVRRADFTFETVLSTERNLNLLRRAKDSGYFVRGIYVLTAHPDINVIRVRARAALGGHGVPEDKIRMRYAKALRLIPQFIALCDVAHLYDNTEEPLRKKKKRKSSCFRWANDFWNLSGIERLTGISEYQKP